MAKGGGKLTKLKSVLKKWNSFTTTNNNNNNKQSSHSISAVANDESSSPLAPELRPVYVGQTRRQYLVSSDVVQHPLFRELVDQSEEFDDVEEDTINVACEVVLFQHLLWMLENADPKPESLDELVEFYAC